MICLCRPYIDVLVNYMRMESSKSAIGCTLKICGMLQATLVVCALQRRLHRCLWESLRWGWRAVTSREQGGLEGRWLQAMVGPGCGHQRFLLSVPSDAHPPCPYVLCHVSTGCHGFLAGCCLETRGGVGERFPVFVPVYRGAFRVYSL